MATYDLDRTELNHLLTPNIDPSVRTAVLDYLYKEIDSHDRDSAGYPLNSPRYPLNLEEQVSGKLEVQVSDGTDALNPQADVLVLTSADNSVTTDGNLK